MIFLDVLTVNGRTSTCRIGARIGKSGNSCILKARAGKVADSDIMRRLTAWLLTRNDLTQFRNAVHIRYRTRRNRRA
jgi:hypothetical protein